MKTLKKNPINYIFISISLILLYYYSYRLATYLRGTDFSVFYCAGKTVLDPATPNHLVYDINTLTDCKIPEIISEDQRRDLHFIYSIPAAYLLSPLTLLPYFHAKSLLITLEVLSFALAVLLLANKISILHKTKPSKFFLIACLWLPLHNDVILGQINSILLLLITIVCIEIRRNSYLAGTVIGIVSLFKLFPLGIALLLSIKNWRIAVSSLMTAGLSIWLTDSEDWFKAIGNISKIGAMPVYQLANEHSLFYFYGYVIFMLGITVFLSYITKLDELFIMSYAITTLFIIMPYVEYHHLVLLILPIIYLISRYSRRSLFFKTIITIPAIMVIIAPSFEPKTLQAIIYISCLTLWILFSFDAIDISHTKYRTSKAIN